MKEGSIIRRSFSSCHFRSEPVGGNKKGLHEEDVKSLSSRGDLTRGAHLSEDKVEEVLVGLPELLEVFSNFQRMKIFLSSLLFFCNFFFSFSLII